MGEARLSEGGLGNARSHAMRGKRLLGVAAALAALFSSPAKAENWVRDVDGWDVGRSGNGCAMIDEYEGEGATQLMLVTNEEDASETFLMLTNYRWSARDGERYELKFYLGDWVYTMSALGIEQDVIRTGFGTLVHGEFLTDLAKADSLKIKRGDVLVDSLSLEGSAAALTVFERCRKEVAAAIEQERRDRERLSHIPVDPFAADAPDAPQ